MTTAAALKLPKVIGDLDLKFGKALAAPLRTLWPEGEKFTLAEQPAAIAAVFIKSSELHRRLVNAKVSYLFRPSIQKNGVEIGATTSRASGKVAYLTGFDFIAEFSHQAWLALTPEQRLALVDHALCACDQDPDTGAYGIRPMDVEEFSEVVARWGAYTMPIRGFSYALERAQIDLFDGTALGLIEEAAPAIADATRRAIKDTADKRTKRGTQKVRDEAGEFELEDEDDDE